MVTSFIYHDIEKKIPVWNFYMIHVFSLSQYCNTLISIAEMSHALRMCDRLAYLCVCQQLNKHGRNIKVHNLFPPYERKWIRIYDHAEVFNE